LSVIAEPAEFYRSGEGGRAPLPGRTANLIAGAETQAADRKQYADDRELVSGLLKKWYNPGIEQKMRELEQPGVSSDRPGGHSPTDAVPYGSAGFDVAVNMEESLADSEGRPSPHSRASVLRLFEQAELHYSQGAYHRALELLDQVVAADKDSVQALKLAVRASYSVAQQQRARPDDSKKALRRAMEYAGRASAAARNVKLHAYSLDLKATQLLYMAMLGDAELVRDTVAGILEESENDGLTLPRPLYLKLVRLQHIAAYRAVKTTEARAEIGARLAVALGPKDSEASKDLIDLMKSAAPLLLAPWEQNP